jgi:virginiamycin B lyase
LSAQDWLFRTGFSLIAASGCIVSEPGVTYVLPSKPDASPLRDGAGGSRSSGGSAGAGQFGGRSGSDPGGAAGVGTGGMGGTGTAGKGGVAGAGGAAGTFRDAGGASGDADRDADARIDAGDFGDTSTDDTEGGADGTTDTDDMDSGADGSTGTGGTGGNTGGTGGSTGGTGGSTGGTGGNTGGTGGSGGRDGSLDAGGPDVSADGGSGTITEFTIPTPNAGAYDIVLGGDFNVWFTEETGNKIGRITRDGVITEYAIPTANALPRGLTAAGGRIYFTEFAANKIGYLNTSNPSVITEVSSLAGPTGIAAATDGAVWYTAVGANEVVKLAADGTAAGHWPTPNGVAGAISLVVSYSLWLGTTAQGRIDTVNPSSNAIASLSFTDDGLGQPVTDMVMDWNDEFMFTDGAVLRSYSGNAFTAPGLMRSVVPGPACAFKNLYITMPIANGILVWSGSSFTIHQLPTANSTPHDLVGGADGNLWFTERTGNKIGRLVP